MKRLLAAVLAALVVLVAVLVGRALTIDSRQMTASHAPPLALDRDAALQRFSRAIQFRTVSL